ncbi:MAG: DUF4838 domain-containing protein [Armatimonadetes bacterium]|nr:DUF4838 domain-containing protein [Armatimonadota bacterium]
MHRVLPMPGRLLAAIAALVGTAGAALAQNVYPDPGFEKTGEPGSARSGARSAHLAVPAATHWAAVGDRIAVEPFARYRVSLWARGSVTGGTVYAPYCYEWDSYEWAFVTAAAVRPSQEWTRYETTFVSPSATMYVHPAAAMDCTQADVRVDDIDVVKVASAASTMAGIAAKPSPSADEVRLLGRWLIARGRRQEVVKLMEAAQGLTRADLATILAAATRTIAERRRFVSEIVACGGPTYHDGMARFTDATHGFSDAERIGAAVAGFSRTTGDDLAAKGLQIVVESILNGPAGPSTVAERKSRLAAATSAMEPLRSQSSAGAAAALASLAVASAKLDAVQRSLGHARVTLAGESVRATTHCIVIPDKASPQEAYAARELRAHLELATGEALPIVLESRHGDRPGLFVGRCKSAPLKLDGLGTEGIHVKTDGRSVYLAGGKRRGALYAVYCFLEEVVGCRWFTPDCSTWPTSGAIAVGKLDTRYLPPLEYRGGDYPVAKEGQFASRLRMNGAFHAISRLQGGNVGVHSLAHTFAALCPPETYFAAHPEYFSLVGGKRQSGYAQLCLTNPSVLKIAIEGVRRWIAQNPGAKVFSVSQNDTFNYCECEACSAVSREEGSQAGPVLRFVNAVADAIRKDYPDVAIETLAYQYTRKPPTITKPRPNVIVCLCSIECCFLHPLGSDDFNKSFVADLQDWARICKRLWIWDYVINYAHSICPFPNLRVLRPNIEFFIKNGVTGVYEESCYFTKGSELQELRNYILAKTLWDPSYDTARATREFCAAYYGSAAPQIMRYLDLMHDSVLAQDGVHVQIYTHPSKYLTPALLASASGLFDDAEAAVRGDPVALHRVKVARLPVIYAQIATAQSGLWVREGDALVKQGATDVTALAETFAATARAEGVTAVREGGGDAALEAWLATVPRTAPRVSLRTLRGGGLTIVVAPELGGRILSLQGASGRELAYQSLSGGGLTAEDSGWDEYSESSYRSPGWLDRYEVLDASATSVTLAAMLSNGMRLTRVVSVDAARPMLKVRSTLTNASGAVRKACLRAHPQFTVPTMVGARVEVATGAGAPSVTLLSAGAEETNSWLEGANLPAGSWSLVWPDGAKVVSRFAAGQVARCLLNRSVAAGRANLELFSPEVGLAPGASITLEREYEVIVP